MAFKPLELDNPIQRERLPDIELPYALPANLMAINLEHYRTATHYLIKTIIFSTISVALARYFGLVVEQYLPLLKTIVFVGLIGLIGAIALRSFVRSSELSPLAVTFGFVLSVVVLLEQNLALQFLPLIAGLILTWSVLDIAHHLVVTNPLPVNDKIIDPRYAKVMLATLVATWAIIFLVFNLGSMTLAFVTSIFGLVTARIVHLKSTRKLRMLVGAGMQSYLCYPEAKKLVPGLIVSSVPIFQLRPLGLILFCIAFTSAWLFRCNPAHFSDLALGMAGAASLSTSLIYLMTAIVFSGAKELKTANTWQSIVAVNQASSTEIVKDSIYIGRVAYDGSPVILDRSLLLQHVHILGSTGSGKTSRALLPLAEQIVADGCSTVIQVDMKAESLEGLATLEAAQRCLFERTGQWIPLKVFSTKHGRHTNVFNPLATSAWRSLSDVEKSELLNNALGLDFGRTYGCSWFTDVSTEVALTALLANPNISSFRQLHTEIDRLMRSNRKGGLPPEIKKAGTHSWLLAKRMASLDALNLTTSPVDSPDAMRNQIDLTECFLSPQLYYFELPTMSSPNTSPAVARLLTNFLMAAGRDIEKKVRVHLIIDEFQNMVTDSMEQLFAMARSTNVSLIIANQNMSDLKAKSRILANSVESNCHWRQWFSVKSGEDMESVKSLMGTREVVKLSKTHSNAGVSMTERTEDVPRAEIQSLQQISDDPRLSLLHVTGDTKGFGKYRGIPFVVQTEFHIASDEFLRRKKRKWPTDLPGQIVGGSTHLKAPQDLPGNDFDSYNGEDDNDGSSHFPGVTFDE